MTEGSPTNWKYYDARVQRLERDLENLLSAPAYQSDDRRLARMYLGFARLVQDRLDPTLRIYIDLVQRYIDTGTFPSELEGIAAHLGELSQRLRATEAQKGISTDQVFLYQLMESVTRPRFTIYPPTDVDPIAWMAAIGVEPQLIEEVVRSVYPEIDAFSSDQN